MFGSADYRSQANRQKNLFRPTQSIIQLSWYFPLYWTICVNYAKSFPLGIWLTRLKVLEWLKLICLNKPRPGAGADNMADEEDGGAAGLGLL